MTALPAARSSASAPPQTGRPALHQLSAAPVQIFRPLASIPQQDTTDRTEFSHLPLHQRAPLAPTLSHPPTPLASRAAPRVSNQPAMDLVLVEKRILRFPAAPSDTLTTSSDTLSVTNLSSCDLAFKVKTTNQARYIVRPNVGVIPAHSHLSILIGLHASLDVPTPGLSKDKFLLCVAEAPGTAITGLPDAYWTERETRPDVQGIKFKVEFVDETHLVEEPPDQVMPVRQHSPNTSSITSPVPRQRDLPPTLAPAPPPGSVVASSVVVDPPVAASASPIPISSRPREENLNPDVVAPVDPDQLLQSANYESAMTRVRELQALLDAKNLELSRLRTELAETRAESERVLKDAPNTPLPANKLLADPFGGVSVAGFGLMLLLFLVLVNVIIRIA